MHFVEYVDAVLHALHVSSSVGFWQHQLGERTGAANGSYRNCRSIIEKHCSESKSKHVLRL
jgi:hypothetical protein